MESITQQRIASQFFLTLILEKHFQCNSADL